jgi:hypothetical protein
VKVLPCIPELQELFEQDSIGKSVTNLLWTRIGELQPRGISDAFLKNSM